MTHCYFVFAAMKKYRGRLSYLPVEKKTELTTNGEVDNVPNDNSCQSIKNKSSLKGLSIPNLNDPVSKEWKVVDDSFTMISCSLQTSLAHDCIMAPESKYDDGYIWLCYIKNNVSRLQMAQFLLSLKDGSHRKLPFVNIIPVYAVRIEPLGGRMTVDGELVELGPIQVSILSSVARIMHK